MDRIDRVVENEREVGVGPYGSTTGRAVGRFPAARCERTSVAIEHQWMRWPFSQRDLDLEIDRLGERLSAKVIARVG